MTKPNDTSFAHCTGFVPTKISGANKTCKYYSLACFTGFKGKFRLHDFTLHTNLCNDKSFYVG